MVASIFHLSKDNQLTELQHSKYDSEDVFQRLLADHPAMLGLSGGIGRKLLLIGRELPVPDALDGDYRWSLDHLFIDRQGVPVLVEVKQESDPRSRREVVAQMLDYAANGVAYWKIEKIISVYNETCVATDGDPVSKLASFLDGEGVEDFWRQVEANLRSGRIRMVIVADRVPKELARIIEFLNEQMRPAEVMAIEVDQFKAPDGTLTLVPRLIGATERAVASKSISSELEPISEDEWFESLETTQGKSSRQEAALLTDWLRKNGFEITISKSQDSLTAHITASDGKQSWPFFIRRSSGRIETSLAYLAARLPYKDSSLRSQLLEDIKRLPAKSLRISAKLNGWPSISLSEFSGNEPLRSAFQALVISIKTQLQRKI